VDARLIGGISAEASERNVGIAAPPVAGPAQTLFVASLLNPIASVPAPVTGDPPIVKPVGTDAPTLVTVPLPPPPLGVPLTRLFPESNPSQPAVTTVPLDIPV
jgi:hypothetical protein